MGLFAASTAAHAWRWRESRHTRRPLLHAWLLRGARCLLPWVPLMASSGCTSATSRTLHSSALAGEAVSRSRRSLNWPSPQTASTSLLARKTDLSSSSDSTRRPPSRTSRPTSRCRLRPLRSRGLQLPSCSVRARLYTTRCMCRLHVLPLVRASFAIRHATILRIM